MIVMRISCVAVLSCLALAACDPDPTFDTSSLPAYQRSLDGITAKLWPEQRRRLQIALLTLADGNAALNDTVALANPKKVADAVTLSGAASPLIFLDRLRPAINGRTAAAVIRLVAHN